MLIYHAVSILRNLASLGDYCRSTREMGRNVDTTVVAIAERSAEAGNVDAPEHSPLLRPTPLVYGRFCALLCASLLTLGAVHAVWQHTLNIDDGMNRTYK